MVINNFRWESFSMAPSWPKHLSQLTPAVGSLRVGSQDHLAAHPLRGADAARLTRKEQIAPMIGYIGYRTSFITMKSTWNPSEIVRFFMSLIHIPLIFPASLGDISFEAWAAQGGEKMCAMGQVCWIWWEMHGHTMEILWESMGYTYYINT